MPEIDPHMQKIYDLFADGAFNNESKESGLSGIEDQHEDAFNIPDAGELDRDELVKKISKLSWDL